MTRSMRGPSLTLVMALAVGLPTGVGAQEPSGSVGSSASGGSPSITPSALPSSSTTPVGAPAPSPSSPPMVSCQDLLVALPPVIGDGTLRAATSRGVEGIDPDDLLDPLLASLGRNRDDLCGVRFGYPPATGPTGQLLRIRDVALDDLATQVGGALATRLRSYGARVADEVVTVDGVPGITLDVLADGQATSLTILAVAPDTVLLVPDGTDPSTLLEALVKASTPET
jgi:hypothetical protein